VIGHLLFSAFSHTPLTTPRSCASYADVMNWKRTCLTCSLLIVLLVSPCWAQGTAEKDLERITVKLADSGRKIHGRLLRLDSQTVSIQMSTGTVDIPLDRVQRIQKDVKDPLWDGALVCALWGAGCTLLGCGGQAIGEEGSFPGDFILAAGVGALLGAGLDALRQKRTTIFEAGRRVAVHPVRAGIGITFSF